MMYHDIESADRLNEKRGTSAYLYVTPAEAFRRQLELIRSLGLHVSTWSGYLQAMRTGRADLSRTVILTFDDGHESVESVAMPIMNEFGIRWQAKQIHFERRPVAPTSASRLGHWGAWLQSYCTDRTG